MRELRKTLASLLKGFNLLWIESCRTHTGLLLLGAEARYSYSVDFNGRSEEYNYIT